MSIRYIATVLDHLPDLKPTDTLVLLALADHANDDGICWPSAASIRRRSRLSERGVRYSLRRLEAAGLLHVELTEGRASTYRLLFDHHGNLSTEPARGGARRAGGGAKRAGGGARRAGGVGHRVPPEPLYEPPSNQRGDKSPTKSKEPRPSDGSTPAIDQILKRTRGRIESNANSASETEAAA